MDFVELEQSGKRLKLLVTNTKLVGRRTWSDTGEKGKLEQIFIYTNFVLLAETIETCSDAQSVSEV